jgi:hypothetical protein
MHRERLSLFAGFAVAFATGSIAVPALAEEPAARVTDTAKALKGQPGAFEAGGFVFRLSLELRLRGELWSDVPASDGPSAVLGKSDARGEHERDALLSERLRFGVAIERGPVAAVVKLEDARSFGERSSAFSGTNGLPYTAPYEAYLDVHTRDRDVFFRAGRQEIVLGDGRLVGKSDGSPIGRSLDALRLAFRIHDFDLQAFGAMLAPPGKGPTGGTLKPGAQLFAVDGTWHIKPFFKAELTGLARIVREPFPRDLTPADTFVAAARLFGDHRGFRYSVVGAFEGGRLAVVGDVRGQVAGAVAGRGEFETALPWHLTFGAQGAYASGGDRSSTTAKTEKTFDPILPDSNEHFAHSGFYAWSNIIEAGGDVAIEPVAPLRIRAGYRFVGLAQPKGEWFSSLLEPVGFSPTNTSHVLGHVVEGMVHVRPWEPLTFIADYGAMILGEGGQAILNQGGTDTKVVHFGLLEAEVRLPD